MYWIVINRLLVAVSSLISTNILPAVLHGSRRHEGILNFDRRCSATNLKPKTSNITMNLPNLLKKTYDHINMGIFLIPQNNGNIFCDDEIKINV